MTEQQFEQYRDRQQRNIELEQRHPFVNAWAKKAYIAELDRDRMGRELAKAQHKIHRQRVALCELNEGIEAIMQEDKRLLLQNEKLRKRVEELEDKIENMEDDLGRAYLGDEW